VMWRSYWHHPIHVLPLPAAPAGGIRSACPWRRHPAARTWARRAASTARPRSPPSPTGRHGSGGPKGRLSLTPPGPTTSGASRNYRAGGSRQVPVVATVATPAQRPGCGQGVGHVRATIASRRTEREIPLALLKPQPTGRIGRAEPAAAASSSTASLDRHGQPAEPGDRLRIGVNGKWTPRRR